MNVDNQQQMNVDNQQQMNVVANDEEIEVEQRIIIYTPTLEGKP